MHSMAGDALKLGKSMHSMAGDALKLGKAIECIDFIFFLGQISPPTLILLTKSSTYIDFVDQKFHLHRFC